MTVYKFSIFAEKKGDPPETFMEYAKRRRVSMASIERGFYLASGIRKTSSPVTEYTAHPFPQNLPIIKR